MRAASLSCRLFAALLIAPILVHGAQNEFGVPEVAKSINALGLDLYREQVKTADGANVLLSPYSISSSLAMAYMGADGETKKEMQKVLRLSADQTECGAAFRSLSEQLTQVVSRSEREVLSRKKDGGDATPIELTVANRLFAQQGYELRAHFLEELRRHFGSDVAELDFKNAPADAREVINQYVGRQTHDRILNLLPVGQPVPDTRLALVNALYLRAAWEDEFEESATRPKPFHFGAGAEAHVPTMRTQQNLRYAKHDRFTVVTLPYLTNELQFVLVVPDATDGLSAVEKLLTESVLADCASLERRDVILLLPKFKLEPETISLEEALESLGLRTAFDQPRGSANFDRMAPRKPDDYFFIGSVVHKTWLSLDEHGTEAAAATAVVYFGAGMPSKPKPPVEVRADRPFMFAIQHVESGACLFLGRVTDPR